MRNFKKGSMIIEEGSKTNELFILAEGRLGVYKNKTKIAELNEKGIVFGEISLILKKPRTVSIKALEDSKIIIIKCTLDQLVKRYPDLTKRIFTGLAKRIVRLTEDYWQLSEKVRIDDKLINQL